MPESNGSQYPEPFVSLYERRFTWSFADHAGLTNFGVVMACVVRNARLNRSLA